ncbi:MAG: hypothetical protein IID16_12520 [Candidatus Marinimicrobia bacterium]|nr:hypothetical protein [Candidatus Neomarinimicrobiota bacterium]
MHKLYTNRGRDDNLVVKRPYLKFRGRFLPIVSIWLKCNDDKEWVEFKAFVDSGAAYSVFQAEMAEILGLSLEDGKMEYMTVGDGSQINVYIHKVRCKLADQPDEPASEEFEATIGFSIPKLRDWNWL